MPAGPLAAHAGRQSWQCSWRVRQWENIGRTRNRAQLGEWSVLGLAPLCLLCAPFPSLSLFPLSFLSLSSFVVSFLSLSLCLYLAYLAFFLSFVSVLDSSLSRTLLHSTPSLSPPWLISLFDRCLPLSTEQLHTARIARPFACCSPAHRDWLTLQAYKCRGLPIRQVLERPDINMHVIPVHQHSSWEGRGAQQAPWLVG